jgi:hypothetical protein
MHDHYESMTLDVEYEVVCGKDTRILHGRGSFKVNPSMTRRLTLDNQE